MAQSASGSMAGQLPLATPSFFFNVFLMILLMASTCPLDSGCVGDAKKMLLLNREQRYRNREQSNCLPLSVTMAFGRPNRHRIFFHTKCSILAAVIVVRASASVRSAPELWASRRPARSASYSASLLEARNWKRIAYSIVVSSEVLRTRPAPLPCRLDEPSTYKVQ
ncbi:unnamed protein product [Prunus armeniaca]